MSITIQYETYVVAKLNVFPNSMSLRVFVRLISETSINMIHCFHFTISNSQDTRASRLLSHKRFSTPQRSIPLLTILLTKSMLLLGISGKVRHEQRVER